MHYSVVVTSASEAFIMEFVLDFNQSNADHIYSINQQVLDRACVDFSTDTYSVHLIRKIHTPKQEPLLTISNGVISDEDKSLKDYSDALKVDEQK